MGKALERLVEIREAWASRADVIRQARAEGEKWEEIAEAIGLSRSVVIETSRKRLDSGRSSE